MKACPLTQAELLATWKYIHTLGLTIDNIDSVYIIYCLTVNDQWNNVQPSSAILCPMSDVVHN